MVSALVMLSSSIPSERGVNRFSTISTLGLAWLKNSEISRFELRSSEMLDLRTR